MSMFASIPNVRDLGDYVLPNGKAIRKGLLLRGGFLTYASDEDLTCLANDYHVRRIFDFRTEAEVTRQPDKEVLGAKPVWLPAIDPETEKVATMALPKDAYKDLPNWLVENASNPLYQQVASRLYTDMVVNEYTQLQYAAFMQMLVNTDEGAVYWHCSQGKDRTGLAASFVLTALGADRELVLKDYNRSYPFYAAEVDRVMEKIYARGGGAAEEALVKTFIGVNVNYFIDGLNLIDKKFGSLLNYVQSVLCVSDADLEVLRNRYLI